MGEILIWKLFRFLLTAEANTALSFLGKDNLGETRPTI